MSGFGGGIGENAGKTHYVDKPETQPWSPFFCIYFPNKIKLLLGKHNSFHAQHYYYAAMMLLCAQTSFSFHNKHTFEEIKHIDT